MLIASYICLGRSIVLSFTANVLESKSTLQTVGTTDEPYSNKYRFE